jgi:hypothetical protein
MTAKLRNLKAWLRFQSSQDKISSVMSIKDRINSLLLIKKYKWEIKEV